MLFECDQMLRAAEDLLDAESLAAYRQMYALSPSRAESEILAVCKRLRSVQEPVRSDLPKIFEFGYVEGFKLSCGIKP